MGTGASREKVFKGGNSREGGRLLKRGLIERKKCLTPFFFFNYSCMEQMAEDGILCGWKYPAVSRWGWC